MNEPKELIEFFTEKAEQLVLKDGIRLSKDVECWKQLRKLWHAVYRVFGTELEDSSLAYIYAYCLPPEDSDSIASNTDGLSNKYVEQSNRYKISTIGICETCLRKEEDYQIFVMLHEFAHVLSDDNGGDVSSHGKQFQETLDDLIERYNEATGSEIINYDD